MFPFHLGWIALFLLTLMGWKTNIDLDLFFRGHKRIVLVYPHTSNWDFIIMVLYRWALPSSYPIFSLVKRSRFRSLKIGNLLTSVGCIPTSSRETTQNVIDGLNTKDQFVFLISPKGTRSRGEWKSDYYYIAQQTGSVIMVGGLDYYEKRIVFRPDFYSPQEPRKTLEEKLKINFHGIHPLYPHYESLSNYSSKEIVSAIDYLTLSHIIGIYPLYLSLSYHYGLFFIGLYFLLRSFHHHYLYEYQEHSFLGKITLGGFLLWRLYVQPELITWKLFTLLGSLAVLYVLGSERHLSVSRTPMYYLSHSLYHLCIAFLFIFLLS